jgi:exopolysaccharide biosynthesis polyprenyl glycosylphosphotransferase
MNKSKKLLLLLGDISILYLSLYITLAIRYQSWPSLSSWQQHFSAFSLVFVFWLIIFYINDLYNLFLAVNNERFFRKTLQAISVAALLSALYFYLSPYIGIAPKTNLLIYIFVFASLFFAWRRTFNWLLHHRVPRLSLAFVGYNSQVKELIRELQTNPHLGFRVAMIVSGHTSGHLDGVKVVNETKKIRTFVRQENINTIILATDLNRSEELRSVLFSCLPMRVNFRSLSDFYEQITGRIPIEAIGETWFLENLSEGSKRSYDIIKRAYDLLIASFILIITAYFWPIIGLLLKIENKEPIFFTQIRAGKDGRTFRMLKFRTQRTVSAIPEPAKKNDTRTTRVGNFLRKTRIDEIPQVINILLGDMSFIGPRPERPEIIASLEQAVPFYNERLLVKPGLTGWDQVSGEYHSPSLEDTLKKLQHDLYYIKNRSLYLDATIVLKTIATIFSRAGV